MHRYIASFNLDFATCSIFRKGEAEPAEKQFLADIIQEMSNLMMRNSPRDRSFCNQWSALPFHIFSKTISMQELENQGKDSILNTYVQEYGVEIKGFDCSVISDINLNLF